MLENKLHFLIYQVKFYQKRGVFLGGQIDPRMLREIKNRGQVAVSIFFIFLSLPHSLCVL